MLHEVEVDGERLSRDGEPILMDRQPVAISSQRTPASVDFDGERGGPFIDEEEEARRRAERRRLARNQRQRNR